MHLESSFTDLHEIDTKTDPAAHEERSEGTIVDLYASKTSESLSNLKHCEMWLVENRAEILRVLAWTGTKEEFEIFWLQFLQDERHIHANLQNNKNLTDWQLSTIVNSVMRQNHRLSIGSIGTLWEKSNADAIEKKRKAETKRRTQLTTWLLSVIRAFA